MKTLLRLLAIVVVGTAIAGAVANYKTAPATTAATEPARPATPKPPPLRESIDFRPVSWEKGGFGVVATVTFSFKNNHKTLSAKDFIVECDATAPSGTRLNRLTTTVYVSVKPGKTLVVRDHNLGFINGQTSGIACSLTHASPA